MLSIGSGLWESAENLDDNNNNEKVSKAFTLQLKVLNNTNVTEYL